VRALDDPVVLALVSSIRSGDVDALRVLLSSDPSLASDRFGDETTSRTALHLATDWPGRFPRVAETIGALVAAGAPVDGRFVGAHRETPLHWAASADDVDAVAALLDAGADIEADGAVLTDGPPLADAVVFAQWNAARLLVDRGATMTIWQAAALGDTRALSELLDAAGPQEITNSCWHACRAGRLDAVEMLVDRGADLDWLGHDGLTPRDAGLASGNDELAARLRHA
jgi:ankyrin repeat protein